MALILLSNGSDTTRPLLFLDDPSCPPTCMLISVAYFAAASKRLAVHPRLDWWALDSGAFSDRIELARYLDVVREAQSLPKPPRMIFSLDVIGDWRASLRYYEAVRAAGVDAIPTYHYGDPPVMLAEILAGYPRLAVGGLARVRGTARQRFLGEAFATCWHATDGVGRRIHGFGISDMRSLFGFPFDTVDSSTWSISTRTGEWPAYGRDESIRPAKGSTLVPEVRRIRDLERRTEVRFGEVLHRVRPVPDP